MTQPSVSVAPLVYRREMPHWGQPYPNRLKRDSLKAALADYILQANHRGYSPDRRKVLAVRIEDRTTSLRNASTPVRDEVYYFVEGEVFSTEGKTRLGEGQTPDELAEKLLEEVYERLWIWAAYDITKGSGAGFRKPFDRPLVVRGSGNPNSDRKTRRPDVAAGVDPAFFVPDPVPPYRAPDGFTPDLPTGEVERFVVELVRSDFRNALPEGDNQPIWGTPLVGIASAHDPLFSRLQDPEVVGPQHRLPEDWVPGAESVVSVFLPFSEAIWRAYRKDSRYSALEFVSGKWNGSKVLNVVRRGLVQYFEDRGARAVAPNIDARYDSDHLLSFWSERHVAFTAGLGTFGLQQGLITASGVYGRIASTVTTLKLTPTVRPYREVYGYCLYAYDGSCGECIPRCPTAAISRTGKEVARCSQNGNGEHFRAWGYAACGHCSTFVPCSRGIPAKLRASLEAIHDR